MSTSRETHAAGSFRLLTLGGLSLVAPNGTVVRQQRRRLALLALVAAAGERGVSRDRLMAWLNPESTIDSARHSLQQLLYYLRQQLGEDAFIGSDPLRLNPAIIESDLTEFETAIRTGLLSHAADIYKGPFLEGFHLADSPEFDEWAATERSRLAAAFSDALLRLATEASAQKDHAQSIRWWRQMAGQDALSGRAAFGLMRALADSGDATAALVHAREHEAVVRSELGGSPDPEVLALVEKLQRAPAPTRVPHAQTRTVKSERKAVSVADVIARESSTSTPIPRDVGARRNVRIWITSGLFAAAAAGYLLLLSANSGRADPDAAMQRFTNSDQIIVADFEAQPGDSLAARALSEVLRTSLGDSRAVSIVSRADIDRALKRMLLPVTARLDRRLVQELAERGGYEGILNGAITPAGKGYVISAHLTAAAGNELISLSETAVSSDELIPAFGRLSNALRKKIGESAAAIDSVPSLPQVTTRSLPALQLFTQSLAETRAGRVLNPRTLTLLREAIAADSTFAMAHRFLGIKLYLLDSVQESIRELRLAERFSDHLTEAERLQTMSTLHLVLRDYSRAADEAEGVLKLRPNGTWALNQIGILDNLLGRYEHSREIARKRGRIEPSGQGDEPIAALYAGRRNDALLLARTFFNAYRDSAGSATHRGARHIMATVHSAAFSYDSVEYYSAPRGETDGGNPGILALSQLSRGQIGRAFSTWGVRAAGAAAGPTPSSFSAKRESAAAAAIVALSLGRTSASRRLDAVLADTAYQNGNPANRPITPVLGLAVAGRAADARRELTKIERALDHDMRAARGPEMSLARGAVLLAENRLAESIGALRHASASIMLSEEACRVCALPWLGRAYEAASVTDSAIVVYERYLSTGDPGRVFADGIWLAVVLRRLGELYANRGDNARAIHRFEQFATLWKDADRELQPQVEAARKRISELRATRPRVAVSR